MYSSGTLKHELRMVGEFLGEGQKEDGKSLHGMQKREGKKGAKRGDSSKRKVGGESGRTENGAKELDPSGFSKERGFCLFRKTGN